VVRCNRGVCPCCGRVNPAPAASNRACSGVWPWEEGRSKARNRRVRKRTFTGREARAAFTSILARSATLAVVPFVLARVFAGDDAGVAACVR